MKIPERAGEETRGHQEHQREGDLRHDQGARKRPRRHAGRAPGRVVQVCTRGTHRWNEAT